MRSYFLAFAGVAVLAPAAAQAQSVEQFYNGKTITFMVGAGAGGSYDIYARVLAAHMSKHIPGKPTIIVKLAGICLLIWAARTRA